MHDMHNIHNITLKILFTLSLVLPIIAGAQIVVPASGLTSPQKSEQRTEQKTELHDHHTPPVLLPEEQERTGRAERPPEDPCETQRNTIEMTVCAKKQFDQGEKELNQSYQSLLKKLSRPDEADIRYSAVKKQLVAAQRAWVTFRENDCQALKTFNEGGTISSIVYLGCMVSHADERTKNLREFIPGGR